MEMDKIDRVLVFSRPKHLLGSRKTVSYDPLSEIPTRLLHPVADYLSGGLLRSFHFLHNVSDQATASGKRG
jgi:hypothetical protein